MPLSKDEMIQIIDSEADIVRAMVVGDPVRAFEYQWAEQEAIAFKSAGYPSAAVPSSVSAWAEAKGWTAQAAADYILAAAQTFRSVMTAIRNTRLIGKEQIRAAVDDEAAAEAAYQTAMQTFATIRQQVGM